MDAARQALKVAIEAGDVDGQVSAQEQMARLSSDAARLGQLKAAEEAQPEKKVNINPQRRAYDTTSCQQMRKLKTGHLIILGLVMIQL